MSQSGCRPWQTPLREELLHQLQYIVIIETAKANGINIYTYLEYLLLYMLDTDWRNYPEVLD
ncbi:transposase domain-containing protein [Anaerocolumna sp. AGMB13020]|nr:transposase domain-containing protein [Anaerocolumna sp. AGMB13020]WOO35812.1 transposase domain-containing protein [Anaerocolumna sp. AGMB13020]